MCPMRERLSLGSFGKTFSSQEKETLKKSFSSSTGADVSARDAWSCYHHLATTYRMYCVWPSGKVGVRTFLLRSLCCEPPVLLGTIVHTLLIK